MAARLTQRQHLKKVSRTADEFAAAATGFEQVRTVADAVLYEGYLLYPYRKSSAKNRVRWQFGVLAPRAWIAARGPAAEGVAGSAESWCQQTECLLEAPPEARVHCRVRFLRVERKVAHERLPDGSTRVVDSLETRSGPELTFDAGVPQEVDVHVTLAELLDGEHRHAIELRAGRDVGRVDEDGRERGRIVRTREGLTAYVLLSAERAAAPFPLLRLRIRVENAVVDLSPDATREEALRHSLVATHVIVGVSPGSFLSLLDPPAWAATAAAECVNLRTFPVLAGPTDESGLVLSSPIILYDHPQIAPESPGDLHDAGEIDEILSLRTLTLTDEEKREAHATDPRAAEILDRTDHLPPELMQRLHGAVRSLRRVHAPQPPPGDEVPWWDPAAEAAVAPDTDTVLVGGVVVGKGSRVRLHPRRRGTDAHDMFLAGRTALVDSVLLDVDGSRHVAVTIEDDPGAELHQWYGRFHYYSPEELEPVLDERDVAREESS